MPQTPLSSPTRASLSPEVAALRPYLYGLLDTLEQKTGWYVSIYFEKKTSQVATVSLKKLSLSHSFTQGVVLRIFNGFTLFEEGSDDLDPETLRKTAQTFAERVARAGTPTHLTPRPYFAPTWTQRLQTSLDSEITSQIPTPVDPQTPVHFGVSSEKDPRNETSENILQTLKKHVERCQTLAPQADLAPNDLNFVSAQQSFNDEEAIFIDRGVNLSQTLYRIVGRVATFSGADRTRFSVGGLGGTEIVEFGDERLLENLRELKALKSAENLVPGRYRVLFAPVTSGVLAHEAFGHSQEGDTCARGRSKAWELFQSGQIVGNEHATILNNPAVYQNGTERGAAWGSYFFDEEGWLAQSQIILEQGRLRAPMTHLTSALRLNVPRTANGKRENWTHGVYTRQTNTYFSQGSSTLKQLLDQIDYGFLASEVAGGMEDPKGMGIQVGLQYLKEIRNGQLTGRVFRGPAGGDIQMTGYVPDVLNSILGKSKIEHDSPSPDRVEHPFNDTGGCGKYHKELVYAGCGGPYMLVDQVILG